MPLPLILGGVAAVAGVAGVGSGIHGAVKMKKANDTMKSAEKQHKESLARFEQCSDTTNKNMDQLGMLELDILNSFEKFSNVFEKIQNRPHFKQYSKDGVEIPEYNGEEIKKVSIGAGVLIGGLGGAAVGTAGGFAAAGATTAAVMALGCASTGTPIAALAGAAATNATLAALGGGAIAAGGGGMALGTTILGATTAGIGLLVGGMIFNITGIALSHKAEEAEKQAEEAAAEIRKINSYLISLSRIAYNYRKSLETVQKIYKGHLDRLQWIVEVEEKTDWNTFTEKERLLTENTSLLVGLLYKMCRVQLVLKSEDEGQMNAINYEAIHSAQNEAEQFVNEKGFQVPA